MPDLPDMRVVDFSARDILPYGLPIQQGTIRAGDNDRHGAGGSACHTGDGACVASDRARPGGTRCHVHSQDHPH